VNEDAGVDVLADPRAITFKKRFADENTRKKIVGTAKGEKEEQYWPED
jgi:hypothetical protein